MLAFLSVQPQTLIPSPFTVRTRDFHSFRRKSQYLSRSNVRIGDSAVVKFGLQHSFPDPEFAQGLVKEVFDRAESVIYTIADAAVSSDSTNVSKQSGDWLSGITSYLESVLKVLKDGLSALHVPYSYGFAIILLTILVKVATFPLTKKQVESTMAVRSLQPQIQAIQKRYDGDKERIQLETARLYKLAGVNPLAGCLPTLATIPIWIGLYRALSNVADEGLLTEGFFWIPTLSGPTTVAARQSGSGISWLFPFVDGHPPLGWSDTLAYLVLPVLLVLSQYISLQIMQSSQINDPNQKNSQALTKFLPLMIGYFALSVPSGLSLYWFTNNILSTAQQVWLQKLGGAKNPVLQKSIPELETRHVERNSNPVPQKSIPEVESRQIENSASGGIRPGERFKQLKEQEARTRQQREEEKRKAEEAAKAVDMGNGENKQEPESAIAKNETAKVNGACSVQDLDKETTKEAYPTNGGVASAKGAASKDAQGSVNNHKKDETVEH